MENFLSDNNDDIDSSFFPKTNQDDEEMIFDEAKPVESKTKLETTSVIPKIDRPNIRNDFDEEANIKLQVLVSNFSDEQLDRYEMYRRSAFSKVSIKRLMNSISGTVPSSNVVIAMAGIAKVFVGEIVEEALEVQRQENSTEQTPTPLEPKHLREAFRRIQQKSRAPAFKTWKSKRRSRF